MTSEQHEDFRRFIANSRRLICDLIVELNNLEDEFNDEPSIDTVKHAYWIMDHLSDAACEEEPDEQPEPSMLN